MSESATDNDLRDLVRTKRLPIRNAIFGNGNDNGLGFGNAKGTLDIVRDRSPCGDTRSAAILEGLMIRLEVSPVSGAAFEHATEDHNVVIGRSSQADVTVSDPSMSRTHARVFHEAETWRVEDLGSRNGTTVNLSLIHI